MSVTVTVAQSSLRSDFHGNGAGAVDGLHCIQKEIEDDLVNLVAVVFDFGQVGSLVEFDLDGVAEDLLAREHDGVFDGGVEIAAHHPRRMRAGGFEQVGKDAIDLVDFETHVLDHGAGGAGRGQIATDDFDDAGDSGERVANLVSQSGCQFAERGQVLCA